MADENQQPTAETAPAQDNGDLTINDLNAMKQIIDVASSRGAFKPGEMVAVGQTYNKLATFLENVAKQSQQTAPATAPAQGA
jgi:hypothetical protein